MNTENLTALRLSTRPCRLPLNNGARAIHNTRFSIISLIPEAHVLETNGDFQQVITLLYENHHLFQAPVTRSGQNILYLLFNIGI